MAARLLLHGESNPEMFYYKIEAHGQKSLLGGKTQGDYARVIPRLYVELDIHHLWHVWHIPPVVRQGGWV